MTAELCGILRVSEAHGFSSSMIGGTVGYNRRWLGAQAHRLPLCSLPPADRCPARHFCNAIGVPMPRFPGVSGSNPLGACTNVFRCQRRVALSGGGKWRTKLGRDESAPDPGVANECRGRV